MRKMKAIGIVGSPRMKNTYSMTKTVLKKTGFDYEIILLKDENIKSCNDCRNCHTTFECQIKDDMQAPPFTKGAGGISGFGCN